MTEVHELWSQVSTKLRETVGDAAWQSHFTAVEPVSYDGGSLTLRAPSTLARERIQTKYLDLLAELMHDELGDDVTVTLCQPSVAYQVDEPSTAPSKSTRDARSSRANPDGLFDTNFLTNGYQKSDRSSDFDPRYTFEDFIIGASNRFAHAAALSVAETPSGSYNPLFIHGEAGLGKTHLLHGIGNYVRSQYPDLYVKYVSTESFLNEFVEAIRKNKTSEFKARYRECDVLLVDDIQFLENKEAFQEEFFHTFNSLYGAHKQIVLTSDRPPRAMSTLEDRLRSRFVMGLITDIQPPDIETRMAIVRKKAEDHRVAIPSEVIEYISEAIRDNIRELEGALTRVSAYSRLNKTPITLGLAQAVLSDIITTPAFQRQITPTEILTVTAKYFSLPTDELVGESRKRPIATARQVGMYLVREMTELSYPAIGKFFGGRDHTTVIHAVEKIAAQMQSSRELYEQVNDLTHQLRGGLPSPQL